jgi:hypothetical protein
MKNAFKKLAEEAASKAKSKKDKKGGKPKDGKSKKKAPEPPPPPIVKKYSSATEFMDLHFPVFDTDDNLDCIGPMRAEQLEECHRVYEALAEFNVSENVIRRALLIPQDRIEAICLENTKNATEGLMVNPLPKEYWRAVIQGGKKKKKKKSKKKKSN